MGSAALARSIVTSRARQDSPAGGGRPRSPSTFRLAALGQVLLWAALPPLSWAPLAWLAAVPWMFLVRQPELSGRRPYIVLWLTSFLFYLAALYWVALPHWAAGLGLVPLALYLGSYFPLFVGLSRVGVHRLRISPVLVSPIVWTGLELARAHLLSGFGMASLAHTQYRWPALVQISDLAGAYAVSFLIVLVGACLARAVPSNGGRWSWWPLVVWLGAIGASLGYGAWRTDVEPGRPGPKVALVQGSIDIDMKYDPREEQQIYDQYCGLSGQAVAAHGDIDLIVWPETMFRYPWFTFDPGARPAIDARVTPEELSARSRLAVSQTIAPLGKPFLLGIDHVHETSRGTERYNAALFLDRQGNQLGEYAKCHLVPFGEYVPLADHFPWLYRLTPLPSGATPGRGPRAFEVGGARVAPNICYENTIAHLLRRQVAELAAEGREPDLLVNLTNDGWFWGSAELDMHLACAVFRAVELRKPFLIAANTGFSAWIDADGRIVVQGPRRATGVIVATPTIDTRRSRYLAWGDWPAGVCLLLTLGLAVTAGLNWLRSRNKAPAGVVTG